MPTISEILCAFEVKAERAIVQELRLMTQEILHMRAHLSLGDRAHADALLLKLDHLERSQQLRYAPADGAPATHASMSSDAPRYWLLLSSGKARGVPPEVAIAFSFDQAVQAAKDRAVQSHWTVAGVARGRTMHCVGVLGHDGATLMSIAPANPVQPDIEGRTRAATTCWMAGHLEPMLQLFQTTSAGS